MKPLLLSLILSAGAAAQAVTPLAFEVASVKPSKPGTRGTQLSTDPGRLTVRNMALIGLVRFAYHVNDFQVAGAPAWFRTERYDIIAKAEDAASDEKIKLMLQTLLAERFKLALHRETREGTTYALVVAKGGPKMKAATEDEHAGLEQSSGGSLTARRVTMSAWANDLQRLTGRPVADETGLTGMYDFSLTWSPDAFQPMNEKQAAAPVDATGPTIYTALQEQLGLKLESRKGAIETLVIDHAEKATGN